MTDFRALDFESGVAGGADRNPVVRQMNDLPHDSADRGYIVAFRQRRDHLVDAACTGLTLSDGRKFAARLLGADPRLEIAVLKIDAAELPHFDLAQAASAAVGDRILAFSNLFGIATGNEPNSVLHGHVAAITRLAARRGTYATTYSGPVYVVDAMTNNAGAAGGALTNRGGRLLAVLGKELRNSQNNTWLNYAVPISELQPAVDDIRAGKARPRDPTEPVIRPAQPVTLSALGLVLVPDVLNKTPPFVQRVQERPARARAEDAALADVHLHVALGQQQPARADRDQRQPAH